MIERSYVICKTESCPQAARWHWLRLKPQLLHIFAPLRETLHDWRTLRANYPSASVKLTGQ